MTVGLTGERKEKKRRVYAIENSGSRPPPTTLPPFLLLLLLLLSFLDMDDMVLVGLVGSFSPFLGST